jgi:hypothetical protein
VDFYHAAEHLKVAFDQVYGTSGAKVLSLRLFHR